MAVYRWMSSPFSKWREMNAFQHITNTSFWSHRQVCCAKDIKRALMCPFFIMVHVWIVCIDEIIPLAATVYVYNKMSWYGHAFHIIVRRAGLLLSQQDFEWRWSVPLFQCLTVLEFSFILFDLCLLITFFNFIMNYVPIVTFWIFTYHKIWILSIMFCFIWSYWIIYFLACL